MGDMGDNATSVLLYDENRTESNQPKVYKNN